MPNLDELRKVLSTVKEPELQQDLVSLNMVKELAFTDGTVRTVIELTTPACPMKDEIKNRIETALKVFPDVKKGNAGFVEKNKFGIIYSIRLRFDA